MESAALVVKIKGSTKRPASAPAEKKGRAKGAASE
jgi:hypothetical protein